ncbi:spore coat protein [Candidatus Roizmanbacteria bacterium CG_4_10_14_0_8_um_filter_33_9]|uniref:glucose-1-phosphate thymidylyltransferase n=1 Tax=Candidatus Roizmanbacteria bacterium CG_4_10_14_0_8_um_filter_33_9 TaxID=1974826 RepID=A0A2M7QI01_9BACT|nr:MAG: spore coat protein [Candidatus Roizmanbacteria bacterium CG_4_10_14_0_8_um_filter_33_9]
MKGLILAGGLATRLRPLTWVTNKHLLPVYNKPMIYYPIESMVKAGIKEVLISSSSNHAGHFANLLKDGSDFGIRFYYAVQKNPKGGIANAILLAEEFAKGEKLMVILGDNIFNTDLKTSVNALEKKEKGAIIYGVKITSDFQQYGIIETDKFGKVISIEEKPQNPKSNIAQTGIYLYDKRVFDFIRKLKPSFRGELEVTDLNNMYLKEGTLECKVLNWWIDAGTSHDELLHANNLVADKVKNNDI